MKHIICIGSEELAKGLNLGLSNITGTKLVHISLPTIPEDDKVEESIIASFSQLVNAIEGLDGSANCSELLNTIAVIGFYDNSISGLQELNPISSTTGPLAVVVAMLVLAFPEVHWCFDTKHPHLPTQWFSYFHMWDAIDHSASISRMCQSTYRGYVPLFDPTGLRNTIRDNIRKQEEDGVPVAPDISVRPQLSAVIEEEEEYAYLHAYIAYKFGFRVNMITSYGMMKSFLANVPKSSPEGVVCEDNLSLMFEDLYLNFPDRNWKLPHRLSRLPDRDQAFPCLANVERRVIITTGHHGRQQDVDTWKINKDYIKQKQKKGEFIEIIFKPGAGVFDTWRRSKLAKTLPNGRARGYQLARGSDILPTSPKRPLDIAKNLLRRKRGLRLKNSSATDSEIQGGHSSPGRLLAIAKCLISRSRRLRLEGSSVRDAVYGAVLALEAQEYLGERTPTTSLEALALKHETEVVAETMFYGIQYNIDLESRFKELSKEVTRVGEWFRPETRKVSKLNAEIRVLTRLLSSFRDNGQFDEEQKTLCRIRRLHRKLWRKKNQLWSWLVWLPRFYVEALLGSLFRFVCALAVWVLLFTVIYTVLLDIPSTHLGYETIWHGLTDAFTAFFGMQPPHDFKSLVEEFPAHATMATAVTLGAIVASFVHLGIFISHLYSLVSRR